MSIRCSTRALEVTPEGLKVAGPEGEAIIPADTVIYAAGQRPLREEAGVLAAAAGEIGAEFYQLGDCVTPKNILAATQTAYHIAKDIGR